MNIRATWLALVLGLPVTSFAATDCQHVDTIGWSEGATFCRTPDGAWAPKAPAWVVEGDGTRVYGCVKPQPIPTLPDGRTSSAEALQKAREGAALYYRITKVLLTCAEERANATSDSAERARIRKAADAAIWRSQAHAAFLKKQLDLQSAATAKPAKTPAVAGFKEGVHYERIVLPVRYDADVELFSSLACHECLSAQQAFDKFRKANPKLTFAYVPVMWGVDEKRGIDFDVYAKAQLVGLLAGEAWHDRVWDRMRSAKMRLANDADIRQIYLGLGMPAADLDRTLESFALQIRLKKARISGESARVVSAPTYIVRGRYRVPQYVLINGAQHYNPAPLLDVVEHVLELSAR